MNFVASARSAIRLAGTFAAAALIGTGTDAAQEPIKIGAFLAVTGPASFLGDPEQKTLDMYVERINAAGGVNGREPRNADSVTRAALGLGSSWTEARRRRREGK